MQGARHENPFGFGFAVGPHRHQYRLSQRRSAVIQRGVGHVHGGQARHHALVFIEYLQRALTGFRLIGRVGAVELAAPDDLPDRRRDVVLVGARAQETERTGHGRRPRVQQPADLPLVQRLRQSRQFADAQHRRNFVEQRLQVRCANRGQHRLDIGRSMGNKRHERRAPDQSASLGLASEPSSSSSSAIAIASYALASSNPSSAAVVLSRKIQPSP